MNYQELKNAIIEVIRTNGNEEITGEVLQFTLLEMVSSLGKDFQFAGVATPQTAITERDDKVAWVLGAGTYENFGIPFTVGVDELAFVLYNGSYSVQKLKVGVVVDDTLTRDGLNPVKGGAIYAEFEKLRAAGYIFAGVTTPAGAPPQNLTEKIFYLCKEGGTYTNFGNLVLQDGLSVLKWNGSLWSADMLFGITDEVTENLASLLTSAGAYLAISAEATLREQGDGALRQDIADEVLARQQQGNTLQHNIDVEVQRAQGAEQQNANDIDALEALVPSQASSQNKLVDLQTMNSSIATATATYRGAYNLVSDLSLTVSATEQQIAAALATKMAALSITPDNNDYCYVQVPTSDATPTQIARVDRYKYNGTAWGFEYSLNNSGFTAAQWAALNSGITSGLVTKLSDLPTYTELMTLFNGKQNTISDLSEIRSGAQAGATAYQIPVGGIPKADLTAALQQALDSFITKSVNDLLNYYLKSETYSKTEVNTLINAIKQFAYVLVQTLPTASADTMNKIYLVPSANPQTQNVKDEYITIATENGGTTTYAWEKIGSTDIDLSGYVTTTALNAALSGKQDILTIGTNMDNTPVASSGRPITSGGVKIAIDATREDLEAAIAAYNGNDVIVGPLPASGQANKIYRVPGADSYTDYMYNSNDLSTPIKITEFELPLFESVSTHYSAQDCTISGYVLSADGSISTNGTYHRTDYIPVIQGQIIKGTIRNGSSNVMDIACFDSNKAYVANSSANVVGTGNVDTFSVVVPEGVAYVIFSEPDNAQYSQFFSVDIITKGLFDNKNVLDKLSEQYGQLYYDGNPVMLSSMSALVCDLPVSDGTGISVGSAYIDSTTGVIKVKLQ